MRASICKHRVAIVPIEDLTLLERLENEIDVTAAKAAMKEPGGESWEQIKSDLGL